MPRFVPNDRPSSLPSLRCFLIGICKTRSMRSARTCAKPGLVATPGSQSAIANSPEAALAIVAVACSAAAVPLDPKLTVAEVERCLLALRPSAVLALRGSDCGGAATWRRQHGFPIIEAIVGATRQIRIASGGAKNRRRLVRLMTPTRRRQRSFCTRQGPPPNQIWSRSAIATCWPSPSGCRLGSI